MTSSISRPPDIARAAPAPRGGQAGATLELALGGRIRRKTLALIRWIAIGGQVAALLVVELWLDFRLPLGTLSMLIALSALVNLFSALLHRGRIWLEEGEARLFLAFDMLQVAGLLALTGGLANPFAVLILAPVTVSASVLSERSTAALAALAVLLETLLAVWHRPLPWFNVGVEIDPLLLGGIWGGLVLATVFIAAYIASLAAERRALGEALAATQSALAREQRLASLGGLAAAVAHELGSPLNTILLVARELQRDVPRDSPFIGDIQLLVEESERCRLLLAELANRDAENPPEGGDPFHSLPVSALLAAAAEPFRREGITVDLKAGGQGEEPVLPRDPALLHGLGTLIQNAIQFATRRVEIVVIWGGGRLDVTVADDGPGFEPAVLARLGEPYVSGESADQLSGRADEPHMGLGVFIAQTLLGHGGAELVFRNRPSGGAEVAISWPLAHLSRKESAT